jgi:hypothetical protein
MLSAFCYTVEHLEAGISKNIQKEERKFTSVIRIERRREWGRRVK